MARLDDMWSHHPEWEEPYETGLHDSVASMSPAPTRKSYRRLWRPSKQCGDLAVLDALEARLEGRASGGLDRLARDLDMQKGTASKVAHRLARLIRKAK
jgi:hypothetical protein